MSARTPGGHRRGWGTLAVVVGVAAAGVAGSVVVGAASGMPGSDLAHLVQVLVPAGLASLAAAWVAARVLARVSLRQRFVAIALVGTVVALANVGLLAMDMFVSEHDASLLTVLLVAGAGVGVAAAVLVARASGVALQRLEITARRLGDGDLDARAGAIDAGPELDTLARTLDEMAGALARARERERGAEQMRRDLITTVSHDLRTPLASLRAMIEAVDDGVVADGPTLRRYSGEMRRSIEQLVAMVDDLFELTQLDAGAIEAETRRASLEDVARTALETVRPAADAKGLAIEADLSLAAGVPCSPRVARVLQNLLVNAVRHTPADGTVRLVASRDGDDVLHLAVEDSGEGIAAEDLPRVFDPFFRADPARSGPGAGLGLALAKRIVEALGGSIGAESNAGTGARFAVRLPLR
jgi:signal transduction histidine kinase